MSLRQFLSFTFTWAMERVPHDKLERWLEEINDPYWEGRRTQQRVTQSVVDNELAAFGRALGAG